MKKLIATLIAGALFAAVAAPASAACYYTWTPATGYVYVCP
jgi:hypothetical protein